MGVTRRRVVFHPAVEEDLAEIYAHYREFDAVLPERFEARLDEQVERLGMFPSPARSSSTPTGACL